MNSRGFALALAALLALSIYLFATAPPPLEPPAEPERQVPVEALFRILAAENDVVRGLYTREIVGPGKAAGLAFDEQWARDTVQAGPLPALFLRGVAKYLEESPVAVSLFLGSDFPISAANAFNGPQGEAFARLKAQDNAPQFLYDAGTQRHTAMFADLAMAGPCVSCHNEHPDSPKTDWELGDVMGATTWLHPQEQLSTAEILAAVQAFRDGARAVYESYLDKSRGFDEPPEIGACWPRERRCLPSGELFMATAASQASPATLAALFGLEESEPSAAP